MAYRFKWTPATDSNDSKYKMLGIVSHLLHEHQPPLCPLCSKSKIRFYYHEFNFVKIRNQRRGTIWIWCPSCFHWVHSSGITLANNVIYNDPLSTESLEKLEGLWLVEDLNRLWENGDLPHEFTV